MRKYTCFTCPFSTNDPEAARGHRAGPSTGRGWFGQGEAHTLSTLSESGRATLDQIVLTLRGFEGEIVVVSGAGGQRADLILFAGRDNTGVPFVTRQLEGRDPDTIKGDDLLIPYGGFAITAHTGGWRSA